MGTTAHNDSALIDPQGMTYMVINSRPSSPLARPSSGEACAVPVTVLMKPSVGTLPTVVTRDSSPSYRSPGLRGFEERRRAAAGGHLLAEAELRKHDTEKMTNLVRRFASLTITCPKSGPRRGECWAESMRLTSTHALLNEGCPLEVWVDGAAVADNNLNGMSISEFAGVEYYPGGASLPPQYNKTGSSCGVLLLWTRER
jgi:hypothetical protein